MEEISLGELFFIIRKWIALIMAIFILSIAISGGVSYFVLKPEYETFTTLMVGKSNEYQAENTIDYNDLILNQKLVTTYGQIIKSRKVTDRVIEKMNLDLSYDNFISKVDVTLVKDTEIIKIQVKDEDPVLATEIANETALVFMDSIKEIMNVENVQIIDDAQVPKNKVSPRPVLNMAIAGVLGLMVGIFLVFLLEFLDNTLKSPDDIEKQLELPVIGTIPLVDNEDEIRLITQKNPKSPISEAFRTLRTNIQFSNIDEDLKTLIVTSSGPSEGKSTLSSNLAATMAENQKKVLLIDCDLRKPRVHKVFKISNLKGLTNLIVGSEKIKDIVHNEEGFENLDILTSGPIPPNPSELLGSNKMKNFLEDAKREYDMIILDSPPIGLVTDSAVLSTIVDGVLLVGAVAQVEMEMLKNSKSLLDKVNANIIGVVLNKVPISGRSYYKYGYYQYEEYYEKD